MTRLTWGNVGERYYETGVDRGVLYVGSNDGVPWNGLTAVEESPSGGELKSYYQDGVLFRNAVSRENFGATLSAYFSPHEFDVCEGIEKVNRGLFVTQQRRTPFGLTYRTRVANDTEGLEFAYKIHLVYNAMALPTPRSYATVTGETSAEPLSWEIVSRPRAMAGVSPTAHLIVDSSDINAQTLLDLENLLYGSDMNAPRLPTPEELVTLFGSAPVFTITDNGDGTYTADPATMLDADSFTLDSASVVMINPDEYSATTL